MTKEKKSNTHLKLFILEQRENNKIQNLKLI